MENKVKMLLFLSPVYGMENLTKLLSEKVRRGAKEHIIREKRFISRRKKLPKPEVLRAEIEGSYTPEERAARAEYKEKLEKYEEELAFWQKNVWFDQDLDMKGKERKGIAAKMAAQGLDLNGKPLLGPMGQEYGFKMGVKSGNQKLKARNKRPHFQGDPPNKPEVPMLCIDKPYYLCTCGMRIKKESYSNEAEQMECPQFREKINQLRVQYQNIYINVNQLIIDLKNKKFGA